MPAASRTSVKPATFALESLAHQVEPQDPRTHEVQARKPQSDGAQIVQPFAHRESPDVQTGGDNQR